MYSIPALGCTSLRSEKWLSAKTLARQSGGRWLRIAWRSTVGPVAGQGQGKSYEVVRAAVEEWIEQEVELPTE